MVSVAVVEPIQVEVISCPGAKMSTQVPQFEKVARWSTWSSPQPLVVRVVAPTVRALTGVLLLKSFIQSAELPLPPWHPDRSMVRWSHKHGVFHFPPQEGCPSHFTFIMHHGFTHHNTRTYVRLLGPCSKTGQLRPFCQHLERAVLVPRPRDTEPVYEPTRVAPCEPTHETLQRSTGTAKPLPTHKYPCVCARTHAHGNCAS